MTHQIQILSDLHLETPAAYDVFEINPVAPYLALLGDIGYVKDEGFFLFLQKQLAAFQIVFLILGNHEPYHSTWAETKSRLHRFQNETQADQTPARGKFILLDQTRYDISPTLTILGCTLFSHVPREHTQDVSFGLNDFYLIDEWTVEAHQHAHSDDLAWLNGEIDSIARAEPHREVIVFTHHCPSTDDRIVDPRHKNSKISSGFRTDLSAELCWQSPIVRLWAFGHTHFNCEFRDPGTGKVVVSNQRGYYFAQAEGFDSERTW